MDLFSEYSAVYLLVLGLSCSMQTLLQHVGSSSLTKDGTWDPSIAHSVPPWVSSPVLLPGKFHGWGSLVGYIQFMGLQSWTWLSDFSFFLSIVPFGEGNGNLLQCSCLENPIDRGAWWAAVYGAAKSQTRLSNYQIDRQTDRQTHTHTHTHTRVSWGMKAFAVPNMTCRWQYFTGGGELKATCPALQTHFGLVFKEWEVRWTKA